MTSLSGNRGFSERLAGPTGRIGSRVPGHRVGQIQQYTPQQIGLFKQLFGNVGPESYLNKLASGDQSQFEDVEAPALQQFNALQGNIASRFSGQGTGGRHSSGFQNTTTSAAQDFAQQLQAQRMGLQRQALIDLQSISSDLLEKRPYQSTVNEKSKPWWQGLLSTFGQSAAKSAGESLFGGGGGGAGNASQFAKFMV